MKKIKKIIGLALSVAMAAGICGCSGSKTASDEVPTLVWYAPGNSQNDMSAVMAEVNKIIEPKIGAKLELKMLDSGSFTEKMSMMITANDEFDLCFTGYINPYKSAVQLGAYVPMTELIEKYAPKLKTEIPEYVWEAAYIDNEIYAVPNMQIMANVQGIFFFEDIAEKYGITSDMEFKDIREVEPYLEKIKNGEPGVYPITGGDTSTFYRDYWLIHESPSMYIRKDTHEIVPAIEMPEYYEYLKMVRSWYEKGYIRSDIDTAIAHDAEDKKAGKYAAFPGRWKPGIENDQKAQYGKSTVFVPFGISTLAGGTDTMTAISKTSKYPEKAMQLLELVNTDKEVYNLISYGIKGKHYEDLGDEYIRPIENSGYSHLASWKFGNQLNALKLEGQAPDVWEQTRKTNDEGEVPVNRGFSLEEASIKSYIAQCNAVKGEYKSLGYGSVANWEEKVKEYKQRLDTAGQQKIRDELQKQFDEWYKNKKK